MNLLTNQQAAETIDGVYNDLEARLMQNIAKHLSDWKQTIDSDRWLIQKLAEIGKLNEENIKIIAEMSGLSQTAAERMLNEMAEAALNNMEPGFAQLARRGLIGEIVEVSKSKNVKQVMGHLQKQAKDALNLTNTTMLHKAQEAFKNLVQTTVSEAIEIMNHNTSSAVTGAEARGQALRKTIKAFNDKGITGFVDKRGRNWTPEAYVNMCMRTTAGSVANEVQTARCKDMGVNLIQIDAHAGARPKCAKDQGKIFDLNDGSGYTEDARGRKIQYYPWKSSSYGEPDGLLGINCGHHKYPFIPGVNIQRYFPTDDLDANNRLYRQTQVQRALERDVRKQKRECMLFDELGDNDAFKEASVKLKTKESNLKDYVDKHKHLHRRKDREQVVGFDKRISTEAVGKAQKHYKEWAKSIGAESGPKTLAGYYDLKYNNSKESRLYKGYVKSVNDGRISPLIKYDRYVETYNQAREELVGIKTKDGRKVEDIPIHLTERIIGTHEWMAPNSSKALKKRLDHKGASVENVKDALQNPEEIAEVKKRKNPHTGMEEESVLYYGENAIVSFNITTGTIIQTEGR